MAAPPPTVSFNNNGNGGTAEAGFGSSSPPNNANGMTQHVEVGGGAHSVKDMRKKGLPWVLAVCALLIIILSIVLCFFLYKEYYSSAAGGGNMFRLTNTALHSKKNNGREAWPSPNPRSALIRFPKAAVVSDNGLCSEIGRSILLKGGNAVDAAVATIACVGALNSHSSGLGGGFLMTFYDPFYGKCTTLDARETAPLSTQRNTYASDPNQAMRGYKSIAVPGELHGYWTAYKRFGSGRIAWQDLLTPTAQLLTNGYPVTKLMEANLRIRQEQVFAEPSMRNFFVNSTTNELLKEGDILKNLQLAETFRKLAVSSDPVRYFYGGELGKQIADEIGEHEGFVTKKDLELYRTIVDDTPLTNDHFLGPNQHLVMCGAKPSSGFAITQLIISIMSKFYPMGSDPEIPYTSVEYYHRLIEAQKFAYAQRTLLGDPKFINASGSIVENMTRAAFTDHIVSQIKSSALKLNEYGGDNTMMPDDHGTSHVSVIDSDGKAVSLTSSVNNIFGAMVRSERLGIIWNDQMDDFSLPGSPNFYGFEPSKANFIEPGKRPMSSMSPMILYDQSTKQVKASIGASGGSKIISAMAQVFLHAVNFNHTIKEAIDMPRLHNQFTPMRTDYEKDFPKAILDGLAARHQNLSEMAFPFATVQAVVRNDADGMLMANCDHRRQVYMYPTGY